MKNLDERIVELYPWIRERAKFYFKRREDAEDLASETIYRLLENREKYDDSYDLKPWCSVVMKNIYSNYYQRSQTVPFVVLEDYHNPYVADAVDYEEMVGILTNLSKVSLNVFCVRLYAEGFSYEEISQMMKVKIGTVRSRIFNGRKTLKIAFGIINVSKS